MQGRGGLKTTPNVESLVYFSLFQINKTKVKKIVSFLPVGCLPLCLILAVVLFIPAK